MNYLGLTLTRPGRIRLGVRRLGSPAISKELVRVRLPGLDRLRGLAVLLMLLDHILLITQPPFIGDALRETLTRASLPLFALVCGALAPWGFIPWCRRWWALIGWGAVCVCLGTPLGLGQPDILWELAICGGFIGILHKLNVFSVLPGGRVGLLVIAMLQPTTWPMRGDGYQIGLVLGLMLVGSLLGEEYLDGYGQWLPDWLAVPGRKALTWYVGHLVALWIFVGGWLWLSTR